VSQGTLAAHRHRGLLGQALDDLMGKLLVVHRLLKAEERLAKRERRADPM
jgi:hypothetical protein